MGGDGSGLRVPAAVAVTAWFASALAVLGYTAIAFAETANGNSAPQFNSPPGSGPISLGIKPSEIGVTGAKPGTGKKLLNQLPELQPIPGFKQTNRGKFVPSREANRRGILGNQK